MKNQKIPPFRRPSATLVFCAGLLCCSAARNVWAQSSAHSYESGLIARVVARHPGVAGLRLDLSPAASPTAAEAPQASSETAMLRRVLKTSAGMAIGSVDVRFAPAIEAARRAQEADAVAADLARHIYTAKSLADPEPFAGNVPVDTRAQHLIDAAMAADPGLITLAMHVTPPGAAQNIIIASNFGRLGKAGDADDLGIIRSGVAKEEVTSGGSRLAVELPLLDAAGHTIGALSTSFAMHDASQRAYLHARAVSLRDALARQIPDLAWLQTS